VLVEMAAAVLVQAVLVQVQMELQILAAAEAVVTTV
jgi:hypothetical protein